MKRRVPISKQRLRAIRKENERAAKKDVSIFKETQRLARLGFGLFSAVFHKKEAVR